ncbi:MAG: TRAP transporter fused permease subunit [Rhodospirillales bacterium]|nr:TRAP transporter fused permease subunit [Rhodospirillales bacterium]
MMFSFEKILRPAIFATCLAMSGYHLLVTQFRFMSPVENQNIHLGFSFAVLFLGLALTHKARTVRLLYLLLAALGVVATVYIHVNYLDLVDMAGFLRPQDAVIGVLLIVLSIEASRSQFGWVIPAMTVCAVLYMMFGSYLPGILHHGGFSFSRTVASVTTTFNGIYGSLLDVSATFIVIFMIFGALLNATGAGKFFMDLACSIGSRFRAGPALAAVISSAIMGSINGSAVANVATTGAVTIPLMKRSGFKPEFAGAVEAAASTGGMFLPPIMGVGAFIMSELTGIAYIDIVIAATIPGILYYFLVGVSVCIRANKDGVSLGVFSDLEPTSRILMRRGYYFIPIIVVLYYMVIGYSPMTAGLYAIYWLVAIHFVVTALTAPKRFLQKSFWMELAGGLVDGAKNGATVAAILAAVGIMIQAIIATGLAHRFLFQVLALASSVEVGLLMTMGLALFFGMGVPTTASYILLAILVAPFLVKLGGPLLAVHLFIYYYTIIANITPPVGSAAIVASRVANSAYMKTCLISIRLAMVALVMPFLFVWHPALLAQGPWYVILEVTVTATVGLIAIAGFWEGYLFCPTRSAERVLMLVGGSMLVLPLPLYATAIGAGLFAFVLFTQWRRSKAMRDLTLEQAPVT